MLLKLIKYLYLVEIYLLLIIFGIIVFSVKDHHSWKIRHSQSMRADPSAITFKVNGVIINSPLNLAAIALGPKVHTSSDRIVVDEDRELFYSPISSLHIYSINTSVLRNEQNGMNNEEYQGNVRDCGIKQSQSSGIIMDNQGVLYYTLLGTNSIAKWNSHTSFESKHKIISKDERFLEWPSAFAFDQDGNITVLVNKLNKFIYDQLNLKEANFRLITSHIGANSYLFNQAYDYGIEPNATKQTTIESRAQQPEILPGSNNDPYLVPHPIPARTDPSTVNTESTILTNPVSQPREEPDPNSEFEMKMMLESELKPEPKAELEPKAKPKAEPEPTSEPQSKPTTEPKPESTVPISEPEPEPSNHAQHKHSNQNTSTPVPASSGTASNSNIFVIIFSAIVGVVLFVCGYLFGRHA